MIYGVLNESEYNQFMLQIISFVSRKIQNIKIVIQI